MRPPSGGMPPGLQGSNGPLGPAVPPSSAAINAAAARWLLLLSHPLSRKMGIFSLYCDKKLHGIIFLCCGFNLVQ
jgi:hypothetical protein